MSQELFQLVVAVAAAASGWVMKMIWNELKELQKADKEVATKISDLTIVVAGQYMRRDEFDKLSAALFVKLDRIEDKLDGKADKVH